MKSVRLLLLTLSLTLCAPTLANAATCADHPNQASAQAAKDTRDADGDGIYCESLACPCAGKGGGASRPKPKPAPRQQPKRQGTSADPATCTRENRTVSISFSKTKYRHIRAHWLDAISQGYPRVLTIHRKGADERRRKLLDGHATAPGMDRDEYPPAMARSSVRASVAHVPSSENRSHGSVMGVKLRRWCSGQRFRVVWF